VSAAATALPELFEVLLEQLVERRRETPGGDDGQMVVVKVQNLPRIRVQNATYASTA